MLQQTTVRAVIPYFERFVARWPTVEALAAAPVDDVMAMWAGLGYYSRARNLKACADAVVRDHAGVFPAEESQLLKLPGIGPYTAAAIAAIAFGRKAMPVDGNIERVVARLFAVRTPLPAAKREIRALAESLTPSRRAGDFAQAMMDLGADICSPRQPSCLVCPLQPNCAANASGLQQVLPMRPAKAEKPIRRGYAFLALREDGAVLLRWRPPSGLLGGMQELPTTEWSDCLPSLRDAARTAPVLAKWRCDEPPIVHVFTHFRLELSVCRALVAEDAELTFWADAERCAWVKRRDLDAAALPTVFRRAIASGLDAF
jgi:A/G-specific adenine glycosylase